MKTRKTKRRGNGEGSVFQRADGRWCATISLPPAPNGKRRRKTLYAKTKTEVLTKLAEERRNRLDGSYCEPTRLTVSEFLDLWLEDAVRPTVRETSYISYQGVVKNHIKPRIGSLLLAKMTPAHVQGLYAAMERDKQSASVRQLTHAVLRRATQQGVRWGLIPRNVCDAVDPPRAKRKPIHPLTKDQVVKLLDAAKGDRLEALYVMAVMTGLRLGELCGLQWSDIDLNEGSLSVQRALVEVNGKLALNEPKTASSRRRVDLPALAVESLWNHKRIQEGEGNDASGFVFCTVMGKPIRRGHLHSQEFKPLLVRAGLPSIRFHDLRHTAATLMLSEGIHPKVVQERLGHSQISMTLDIYSHVLPSMQRDAADRLDRLFRPENEELATQWLHFRPIAGCGFDRNEQAGQL